MSKKKRNKIYRNLLRDYKKELTSSTGYDFLGLCYNLEGNIKDFPELIKHKPKSTYDELYWFPCSDTEKRINIINQAIKETKYSLIDVILRR